MSTELGQTILCESKLKKLFDLVEMLKCFQVVWLDEYLQRKDRFSKEIEGFICTKAGLIDKQFLDHLPNLKVVSICSAGFEGLDVSMLHRLNIRVSNVPHLVSESTADLTFALILATARQLRKNIQSSQHPDLEVRMSPQFTSLGTDVTGATLGILGMGSIGYCVAMRATGFRMNTFYYNRNRRPKLDEDCVNAKYCRSLDELLKLSQFLVISVPLTQETENMIGHRELALMKPSSILINVSRGCVVDTSALVEALNDGKISAAGLDVTEPEPLPYDHPLVHMDNVILSGHSGAATVEVRKQIFKQSLENLKAGFTSGPMNNEL
ncbi:probable 2-ketogluconate reductase [Antedon mediterranea]|uniref:probable 2-ketogluconate reductase n=1 Tax=Antedon mediterranea TaxID=105859 RepID=UPI003AF70B49